MVFGSASSLQKNRQQTIVTGVIHDKAKREIARKLTHVFVALIIDLHSQKCGKQNTEKKGKKKVDVTLT